ncbi:type I-F CRISPR-associated protein Csy2 [Kerstersia sp.]|uniref:type I-F CRISPR-associated protein Csy2 n=1 Tax=Kerstersia sp. TaxID=1930783 RepID=UPI003F90F0B5
MTDFRHTLAGKGWLVLPHLRIQNANAISSPLTHGFPAMTAFLGLMWALERKMAAANIPLVLEKVGVICHWHEEQVHDGYVKTFRLSRNPVDKDGSTAAIVEEGRIHLDITLVFQVDGGDIGDSNNVLYQGKEKQQELAWTIRNMLSVMRIAGGSVVHHLPEPGHSITPALLPVPEQMEARAEQFRLLRRRWLPGFALVSRDDLLQQRLLQLQAHQADATILDAWLDLARFNWRSNKEENGKKENGKKENGKVSWQHDRPQGAGWLVPIPVGYGALSELYQGGQVGHARDNKTPFRFVESLYSLGQWVSPHRLADITDLLWWADTQADAGRYRCCNGYRPMVEIDAELDASAETEHSNH